MTWQDVIYSASILVIAFGVVVFLTILYGLVTGADKRYAEMRLQHLEQVRRVQRKLDKDDN